MPSQKLDPLERTDGERLALAALSRRRKTAYVLALRLRVIFGLRRRHVQEKVRDVVGS